MMLYVHTCVNHKTGQTIFMFTYFAYFHDGGRKVAKYVTDITGLTDAPIQEEPGVSVHGCQSHQRGRRAKVSFSALSKVIRPPQGYSSIVKMKKQPGHCCLALERWLRG